MFFCYVYSCAKWGRNAIVTMNMLAEIYPMKKPAEAWLPNPEEKGEVSCVILCNVDGVSTDRYGLPQCEVFQREVYRKKVPTHAPAITGASEEAKFHNELVSCLLLYAWPLDTQITSTSLSLSLSHTHTLLLCLL